VETCGTHDFCALEGELLRGALQVDGPEHKPPLLRLELLLALPRLALQLLGTPDHVARAGHLEGEEGGGEG
jgi:hypothetical protein